MKVSRVSFSSDRKLARCEQQYSYNYEEKLQLKRKKIGLFRGDLGHQLVQAHYTRINGVSHPGWRSKLDELRKERWDKLFDGEKEEYGMDFMDTLYQLMEHYEEHWADWDKNWTVIGVEQEYSIMTKSGFPIVWKADLLVQEPVKVSTARRIKGHETVRTILVEHKFKKTIPEVEERILQPQVHSYAWLLSKKGITVDSILWDYIRTSPVPRPKINKNGELSIRQINTDQRGYLLSLSEAGIKATTPDEIIGLENKLKTLPETMSLERVRNSVNLHMGQEFVRQWVERAERAKNNKPLRNWNSDCKFDCDFFTLCQVDMLGNQDRNLVILKNYEKKPSREESK